MRIMEIKFIQKKERMIELPEETKEKIRKIVSEVIKREVNNP